MENGQGMLVSILGLQKNRIFILGNGGSRMV